MSWDILGTIVTNAEARCNKSLRPRKPEGSLGRTAQDVHLDSHTAPELWRRTSVISGFIPPLCLASYIRHIWLYTTISTGFVHLLYLVLYRHFGWLRTSVISGFIAPFRLVLYICRIWFYTTISAGFVHLSYLVLYHHYGWLRTSVISGFIPPLWPASYICHVWFSFQVYRPSRPFHVVAVLLQSMYTLLWRISRLR